MAIAVIGHDMSDGLNTVTLMLVNRNTSRRALALLMMDAVAPILGTLSTFLFTIQGVALPLYLGFFAGFLLYIGASDILPAAHGKHKLSGNRGADGGRRGVRVSRHSAGVTERDGAVDRVDGRGLRSAR